MARSLGRIGQGICGISGVILCVILAFGAAQTATADPVFVQPVDCDLGETCYIQYLVDRDPTDAVQDFACGSLSYDGHKGTDFALLSLNQMAEGVDVLAAAPGVVRGIRDSMADQIYGPQNADDVAGRECGNGLVIDHGGGWVSQYCHLKQGSLTVQPGQRVAANHVLGDIGLSGKTQFPHLHISVRYQDEVIDPFEPYASGCSLDPKLDDTLWQDPPAYVPGGLIDVGFNIKVPDYAVIKAGDAHVHQLDRNAPALVGWAYGYGVRQGDVMQIQITGPEGTVIDKDILLQKSQPQMFRAIGRKRPDGGWAAGRYETRAALLRGGDVLASRTVWVEVR